MKKTYFASDFHLGSPDYASSLQREKKIVAWLNTIQSDAERIFLVGDIFDFWYEYKTVVPRYYTRLLGKLAELTDSGIEILFFKGNHDMWTFGYLEKEIGLQVINEEWSGNIGNKTFFIHHGDALGPGDFSYKFIRKVFRSRWAIWLFHRMHPNFGIGLANFFSKKSRAKNQQGKAGIIPREMEYQYRFALNMLKNKSIDFFIFGHRHQPENIKISDGTRLINLGDWIDHFTYVIFDGNELEIKTYQP